VAAISVSALDDGDILSGSQCFAEPNTKDQGSFSSVSMFFMLMAFLWLAYFLWKTYKMASDDFQSLEQNYSDLAVAESLVDRLCNENKAFRAEINEMQGQKTRQTVCTMESSC
jgi:hypothetical protein